LHLFLYAYKNDTIIFTYYFIETVMEVVKLNTYIVGTPQPHIGGMYWIFLSIETKCGITGIGEVYSASFHPEVVVKAIEDVFGRYLKGQDPHHVERL